MALPIEYSKRASITSLLNYNSEDDEEEDSSVLDTLWGIFNTIGRVKGIPGEAQWFWRKLLDLDLKGTLFFAGHMSNKQLPETLERQHESLEEGSSLPPTYIIIRITRDVRDKTLIWLVDKIRAKRRDGGAELLVFREPPGYSQVWFWQSKSLSWKQ